MPPRLSPRLGAPSRVSPPDCRRAARGGRCLFARWALHTMGIVPRAWLCTTGGTQPSVADCPVRGVTGCWPSAITDSMCAPRQMRMRGTRSQVRRVPSQHDSPSHVQITCPVSPLLHPTLSLPSNVVHSRPELSLKYRDFKWPYLGHFLTDLGISKSNRH